MATAKAEDGLGKGVGYSPLEQDFADDARKLRKRRIVEISLVVTAVLSVAAISAGAMIGITRHRQTTVKKQCEAGLMFLSGDQVLLLHNDSARDDKTWNLPGGPVQEHDPNLLLTVTAKAREQLGHLPAFELLTQINTTRGKQGELDYRVFVCALKGLKTDFIGSETSDKDDYFTHHWFDVNGVDEREDVYDGVKLLFNGKQAREQLSTAYMINKYSLNAKQKPEQKITKLGAGLFLRAKGDILLLTRNSSHNNATLSVPGGNVDLDDQHLRATAEREAVEEMGACPKYKYKGEIDTRRGSHKEKLFKLYLGEMSDSLRYSFRPVLDEESLDWGWYPLKDLHKRNDLHPVVNILLKDHKKQVDKIFKKK